MMIAIACVLGGAGAFAAGCGPAGHGFGQDDGDGGLSDMGEDTEGGATSPTSDAGRSGPSGLPCDVDGMLEKYCASCHGASPSSGTALVSWADLQAKAKTDPTKTEAQLSLSRMQNKTMPPANQPQPTSAEIAAFGAWVSGGTPTGTCGGAGPTDAGPDPFAGPHVCTSKQYYTSGVGMTMEPGNACVACHKTRGAPLFAIAGTVYPTAHEPARCKAPASQGAVIVITDKNGKKYSLTANSVGNFAATGALALPYTAEVQFKGKSRAMATPQTSGDCNSCHTESGTNKAPGRVLLP